jgi:hypothetical protein
MGPSLSPIHSALSATVRSVGIFQKFSNDFGLLYNDDNVLLSQARGLRPIAKTAGIDLTNYELQFKGTIIALRSLFPDQGIQLRLGLQVFLAQGRLYRPVYLLSWASIRNSRIQEPVVYLSDSQLMAPRRLYI